MSVPHSKFFISGTADSGAGFANQTAFMAYPQARITLNQGLTAGQLIVYGMSSAKRGEQGF